MSLGTSGNVTVPSFTVSLKSSLGPMTQAVEVMLVEDAFAWVAMLAVEVSALARSLKLATTPEPL